MVDRLTFALRGAFGLNVYRNIEKPEPIFEHPRQPPDDIRVLQFSPDGDYFAFCDGDHVVLVESQTSKELLKLPITKSTQIEFSPKSRFFYAWEPYLIYGLRRAKDGTLRTPNPNLNMFSVTDRKLLFTTIAPRREDVPQWTNDEKYAVRLSGSEVLFFTGDKLEHSAFKKVIPDIKAISVSPHKKDHAYAAFIPSVKGDPARAEVHRIQQNPEKTLIASEVFMACDKMELKWNSLGTVLLVQAIAEVDNSGRSYYGQSFLRLLCLTGEKSKVDLDKEGPVHDVQWSPSGTHFAVVYGFMPAKVSLFDRRGRPTWDLGEGSRNELAFNPQGNLLALCGFGSLSSGNIEIWNTDKQTLVNKIAVANTTHLEFAPDGKHFYTTTTAPRMRVDNCYRFWHYSGKLLFEYAPERYELWTVVWRPFQVTTKFAAEDLTRDDKLKTGLHIRNNEGKVVAAAGGVRAAGKYVPPAKRTPAQQAAYASQSPGDVLKKPSEAAKKLIKCNKILKDIEKLKEKVKSGGTLEVNQLQKIKKEPEYLHEAEVLQKRIAEEESAAVV